MQQFDHGLLTRMTIEVPPGLADAAHGALRDQPRLDQLAADTGDRHSQLTDPPIHLTYIASP